MGIVYMFLVYAILRIGRGCDQPVFDGKNSTAVDVAYSQTVSLTCSGNNFDKITWFHTPPDSTTASSFPFPWCRNKKCIFLNENTTLLITSIPMEASGVIQCNGRCSETGKTATLMIYLAVHSCTIPPPPKLYDIRNVSAITGKPVSIQCKVNFICLSRIDPQTIDWGWNNSKIVNGTKGFTIIEAKSADGVRINSTLEFYVTEESFQHPFVCTASALDYTKALIYLYKKDPPIHRGIQVVVIVTIIVLCPITLLFGIVMTYLCCWPFIQLEYKRWKQRTSKTNNVEENALVQRETYDVFIYHDDNHIEEMSSISSYLSDKKFTVIDGINSGQAYSTIRTQIERCQSLICISDWSDMLASVLQEASEQMQTTLIIVRTKHMDLANTTRVNAKYMDFPNKEECLYSHKHRIFFNKLELMLIQNRT